MFDKYTEKARRVIFFARYEASQFGSPSIESEHLLLGILREDKGLINQYLRADTSIDDIRTRIEAHSGKRKPLPTNQDLPLSKEARRVLSYAEEEAHELASPTIGTEHLFLGLLRAKSSLAASLLNEHGIKISAVREEPPAPTPAPKAAPKTAAAPKPEVAPVPPPPPAVPAAPAEVPIAIAPVAVAPVAAAPAPIVIPAAPPVPEGTFRDLTQAAKEGAFDPIVGREVEIDIVIEVLSGTQRCNPILVGLLGAGKTAVVQGLAQRIAEGQVPPHLANRRIIEVDPEFIASAATDRIAFDSLMRQLVGISKPEDTILLVDCFLRLSTEAVRPRSQDFSGFLQWTLSQPGLRCIAIAEDKEFPLAAQLSPWLVQEFREIRVRPLSEEATLVALQNRRVVLEKFHGVKYDDASLEAAMRAATRDMSGATLPRTAFELLDVAGCIVKLRRSKPTTEIDDILKKLDSLATQKKSAMQKKEFDKATEIGEEERKEQERLRALQQKKPSKNSGPEVIAPEDVKAVIARWSAYPYSQ
jgi:ATP-dependent Clp protease ATP-binding subunit ClpC